MFHPKIVESFRKEKLESGDKQKVQLDQAVHIAWELLRNNPSRPNHLSSETDVIQKIFPREYDLQDEFQDFLKSPDQQNVLDAALAEAGRAMEEK
jgi:hypothetical protein